MTSRDFCYWLQGAFEVAGTETLSAEQVATVKLRGACDRLRDETFSLREQLSAANAHLADRRRGEWLHEYKCWPQFYEACADGSKSFEIRKDDRPTRPRVGETILLREWSKILGEYTGQSCELRVTYVLLGDDTFLPKGTYCMGIRLHGPLPTVAETERVGGV